MQGQTQEEHKEEQSTPFTVRKLQPRWRGEREFSVSVVVGPEDWREKQRLDPIWEGAIHTSCAS